MYRPSFSSLRQKSCPFNHLKFDSLKYLTKQIYLITNSSRLTACFTASRATSVL